MTIWHPRLQVRRWLAQCRGYWHFSTPAAHRAGCAELSRNVIQVSDYVPSALILR
jgi:hypothetical protein